MTKIFTLQVFNRYRAILDKGVPLVLPAQKRLADAYAERCAVIDALRQQVAILKGRQKESDENMKLAEQVIADHGLTDEHMARYTAMEEGVEWKDGDL